MLHCKHHSTLHRTSLSSCTITHTSLYMQLTYKTFRETAASENSSCYFPLLDRIAFGTFADSISPEAVYKRFVEVLVEDGHLNTPEALSSFKFALAIHEAAPRIEAHYQYYNSTVKPLMMAAQDAACPVWVHFDSQQYCSPTMERPQQPVEFAGTDDTLPFDRTLGHSDDLPASIIYADITSPMFAEFHQTISKTAKDGQTSYRVRYRPSIEETIPTPLFLNGYGVELALKRTDYIVIDDREASSSQPEAETMPEKFDEEDVPADIKPLSKSELASLGVNAASYVMSSSDPFDTLIKVSQDFPKYSAAIANHNATEGFLSAFKANKEEFLPAGYNIMWINGLQIGPRDINAYSLLEHLRNERRLINSFRDEGLSAAEAINLLSHGDIAQAQVEDEPQRYDYRDELEGGKVVIWLNDIEKDKRYERWPSTLSTYLQRTYPGQLPTVRRDLHNLLVPVDLADPQELELIVATLQNFIKRTIPLRIGLVPTLRSQSSKAQAKIAYHILETYGIAAMLQYFEECLKSGKAGAPHKSSFNTAIKDRKVRRDQEPSAFESIEETSTSNERVSAVSTYLQRLAIDGPSPPLFINGIAIPRSENWLETMSNRVSVDLRSIQRGIHEQVFAEDMWLPDFYLYQAAKGRNPLVIPEDPTDEKNIALSQIAQECGHDLENLPSVKPAAEVHGHSSVHLLVVADLDTESGKTLLLDALRFRKAHPELELRILHNSPSDTTCSEFSSKVHRAIVSEQVADVGQLIAQIEMLDPHAEATDCHSPITRQSARGLAAGLGLAPGESGLLLNQRLVGPIGAEAFPVEDFEHLLSYESKKHFTPLATALGALGLDSKVQSALSVAKLNSLVALAFISDIPEGIYENPPLIRIDKFKGWSEGHDSIHVSTTDDPLLQIFVALDPSVEIAQLWLPILRTLSELDGVDLKIFLNPRERIQELSIKRFYRQVLDSEPRFEEDGSLRRPEATFSGMPEAALLNLGIHVPPSWLVAPKICTYDLDNIKLNSMPQDQNIDAIYELQHILVEGHSRDTLTGQPPRGVQLQLGTESNPHFTDTIIMANLGYFQFKANPGFWHISLRPGRSSKVFSIESLGYKGYRARPGDEGSSVALLSFQGVTLYPRLARKPGMEDEDVLESGPKPGSAMDYLNRGASLASSALSSITKTSSGAVNADINIFSVASGHLYERMLNIMILSVIKNTKSTVKFWFIEQFLSPSFKELLPHLAAHYNFSYEMVTYKWPHWLRGQKEKQREIWGYKILFLDVLFPLSLDKVIFVDADQTVRTDMLELTKVDLHGAPYGFTPMCDSREEMEGFRFWKQGYWKQYLQGKPYHISALYVVDLKKFREVAAGDRLRQQYHVLSADPASLSNLDQDLPNHMQHQLPIHSLSQDWLWCETWCSDEAFKTAKTVDLCNNPLTKEPKLDRARRQVPEWTEYDNEITEAAKQIAQSLSAASGSDHLKDGVQASMDQARKRDEL